MSTTPPESLPYWMILFSFIASSLLALLAIVEGIFRVMQKSSLDIVLTREIFFRILESGESLYANVVLVALDKGAMIQGISATLEKHNGSTKSFNLLVAQIGEKYRTSDGGYQFSFHSTSPLAFVPPNNPQRQVFVCEHESYANATQKCFQRFQQTLYQIKEQYTGTDTSDPAALQQLDLDIKQAVDDTVVTVMDNVQLEQGKYILNICVTYKQKSKYFPRALLRTTTSKVSFTVEEFAREYLRLSLREYLNGRVKYVIFDQHSDASAPEYSPSEIKEHINTK